jgi:hypothetical protein
MFQLATKPKHVFEETAPPDHPGRGEQREWTCKLCKVVRITTLPDGKRMWRIPGVAQQIVCERAPDCVAAVHDAAATSEASAA